MNDLLHTKWMKLVSIGCIHLLLFRVMLMPIVSYAAEITSDDIQRLNLSLDVTYHENGSFSIEGSDFSMYVEPDADKNLLANINYLGDTHFVLFTPNADGTYSVVPSRTRIGILAWVGVTVGAAVVSWIVGKALDKALEKAFPGDKPKNKLKIEIKKDKDDKIKSIKIEGEYDGEIKIKILAVELEKFLISADSTEIQLDWTTFTEINNAGFRIWRAIKDQYTNYKPTLLREFGHPKQVNPELDENCSTKIQGQLKVDNSNRFPKLISAIGNSAESTCYSFIDTSNLSDGTYYYLLEDINDNGNSTFHCDLIDAVTIGQGPVIDLESAINYCKEVIGSND